MNLYLENTYKIHNIWYKLNFILRFNHVCCTCVEFNNCMNKCKPTRKKSKYYRVYSCNSYKIDKLY